MIAFVVTSPNQLKAQGAGSPADRSKAPHIQTSQPNANLRLVMPKTDAAKGRILFASKGCVLCHAVNGIGGSDAAQLDASTMPGMTNPFDFVANMWRGAEPMIALQKEELGGQVEFTGDELADIIAFLHDDAEQKKFSKSDIPPKIRAALDEMQKGEDEMRGMKKNSK